MTTRYAVVFADGGSRGNPGPSGAGALVREDSADGKVVGEVAKFIGTGTNNYAEYTGLIIGLEQALELGFERVEVRMDSQLVVRQMNGMYRVKNENLKPLYSKASSLASRFQEFRIVHVRREENKDADRLANQAMDSAANK